MDKFLVRQPKRPRLEDAPPAADNPPPSTIVSHNCNSIKCRVEQDHAQALVNYVLANNVDALLLQETRLKREDQRACEQYLKRAGLQDWQFYWNSHPSKRYSGTALIVRGSCTPISVQYSITKYVDCAAERYPAGDKAPENPEAEARVIIAEYSRCFLVVVYTPNCSWYAPGRAKRAVWDSRFRSAIRTLQATKPVVLAGDLNVCHLDLDVSHPAFFTDATKPGNVDSRGERGEPGQPGFVKFERDNFAALLQECALVDSFRALHPTSQRLTWGFGNSWATTRYRDKFMGLDYVLVSRSLFEQGVVLESTVGGPHTAFGSDHCCVVAKLAWDKLHVGGGGAVGGDVGGGGSPAAPSAAPGSVVEAANGQAGSVTEAADGQAGSVPGKGAQGLAAVD